ncbi:PLD-like domain-containing protein [Chryseobacterium soldanellicola]|uniref:phospholipase D n=1 Tax=Chryseobacterium soldanellicola TaxID=311333 RepID=A0A1H0YFG6_9FLAO|nr:phospholipase D-like domain-containing protein [Chryseobacterium soldanellicola]SDQ13780.1 PLD-like domain-containing protein [Chryseobacterium soldanellicola]
MGTFYNNAICDIYIGKSAGKKLLGDIRGAKKNVKIVSPYLSPFLIKELIYLHSKGIDINLITTDNIEDFYGGYEKNIHKLIIQNKLVDDNAKQSRDHLVNMSKTLLFAIIGLVIALFAIMYLLKDLKPAYGFIIVGLMVLIRENMIKKIRTTKIYSYVYRQLFPFRVFVSPNKYGAFNETFIHSKIYVIDDEIAYLGSLNFTGNGIKENHETRIRTTDYYAVNKIVEEVNELFFNSNLAERDIQFWGSQLYGEPIN